MCQRRRSSGGRRSAMSAAQYKVAAAEWNAGECCRHESTQEEAVILPRHPARA